jgi:hypothetical protein
MGANSVTFKKTARSIQSSNGRKFAQSGRPDSRNFDSESKSQQKSLKWKKPLREKAVPLV